MSSPVTRAQQIVPREADIFSREYPYKYQVADALIFMTYGEFIDIAKRLVELTQEALGVNADVKANPADINKQGKVLWNWAVETRNERYQRQTRSDTDSLSSVQGNDELPRVVSDRNPGHPPRR